MKLKRTILLLVMSLLLVSSAFAQGGFINKYEYDELNENIDRASIRTFNMSQERNQIRALTGFSKQNGLINDCGFHNNRLDATIPCHIEFVENDSPAERYSFQVKKSGEFLGFDVTPFIEFEVDADGEVISQRKNVWQRFHELGWLSYNEVAE